MLEFEVGESWVVYMQYNDQSDASRARDIKVQGAPIQPHFAANLQLVKVYGEKLLHGGQKGLSTRRIF